MRIGEEKEGERRMKEEGKGAKEYKVWGREGRGKKDVERGERGEGMRGLGKRGKGKGTLRRSTEVGNKNKGLVGKRGEIKVWGEGEVNWGKLL